VRNIYGFTSQKHRRNKSVYKLLNRILTKKKEKKNTSENEYLSAKVVWIEFHFSILCIKMNEQ